MPLPHGWLLILTLVLAYGTGLWTQLQHHAAGATEAHELPLAIHWLRDASLAVPAVALGITVAVWIWRRVRPTATGMSLELAGSLGATVALGAGAPLHGLLFGAHHGESPIAVHAAVEALTLLPCSVVLAAVVGLCRVDSWRALPRASALGAATLAVLAGSLAGAGAPQATAQSGSACPTGARTVTYDVAAFQNVIPLNGWGDHIPDGLMYALKGADARIGKQHMVANPNLTQPLVIRANVGDCVKVTLRNDIAGRRIGMHVDGLLRHDPKNSDGARIGRNPDTTVGTGGTVTYTWYAHRVGEAPLMDVANIDGGDPRHPSVQLGLYGAVVVHPQGSTWHNQKTGKDLLDPATGRAVETQVYADIRRPGPDNDKRSLVMVFMDENEDVLDATGQEPTYPSTGLPDTTFGINYRAEPLRNRLRAVLDHRAGKTITLPNQRVIKPEDHFCDGYVPELGRTVDDPGARCQSEESHLQSWPFGDEGKLTRKLADGRVVTDTDNLIPKAYQGDPVDFHIVHPGAKETHPWHQHTQRWLANPDNPRSPRNDVQSLSPGDARVLAIEGGAGGVQKTIGDSIFHCHLYPHFAQGFWGHLRIFDRLRDGTQKYPDGTELEPLQELPDRAGATPAPDAAHPGFPLFVKGEVGQRAYRIPHGVVKDDFQSLRRPGDTIRQPTQLEADNLPALDPAKPGAGYIDPCPTGAPLRTYRPHAIDMPITYNSAGWHDPEGRVYVEERHKADVLNGTRKLEPYTIRARVGDCVELRTTNDLHLDDNPAHPVDHLGKRDGVYFHTEQTTEVSTHVHLVEFDELGSDGTSVGWNYVQAAMPGQTYGYRWFVDQPLRTVFFHDHQYANLHQQKGLFAAMNVEPADATWHDPETGAETDGVGTVADIRSPSGPDFREMTLFHQDRAPMWKRNGDPVQPPPAVGDYGADQGGYAFNYRNEPFQIRTGPGDPMPKGDPAYIYSSAVHGDPSTPLLRAYYRDPVIVRNVVGSHEEMHNFNMHGHRWLSEPDNPNSTLVDNQALGLAEYFNYEVKGSTVLKYTSSTVDTLRKARQGAMNGTPSVLNGGAGPAADYLYGSTPLDDQWLGLWGIFRVPAARVPDLQPLQDRAAPPEGASPWPALKPGEALRKRPSEIANICPATAMRRLFNVSVLRTKITYNKTTGDHDPLGLAYVLAGDEAAVKAGTKNPEPLVIRARAGECVQLTLTNKLPLEGLPKHDGDVPLPADSPFPKSNRVSMHAGLLEYDATRSDGATVGRNFDQTVGPNESITYFWYADPKLEGAAVNLVDFGDRRGHRHHGLFGGLMIEPKNATWTDPTTGKTLLSGAAANIKWTDASGVVRSEREFVVNLQDGLNLRAPNGAPLPPAQEVEEPYEGGHRGINYRTERFAPRLARNPEQAWVMSSDIHGDPQTPVFRAYAGDPVKFKVLQGGDRGRAHSFLLHGHAWRSEIDDPLSTLRTAQGSVLPGRSMTLSLVGGAGSGGAGGDYLFRDGDLTNQVNAGLWGLFRVHNVTQADLKPLG